MLAGRDGGMNWMDLVIRLHGFTIVRLAWAKIILKNKSEMYSATPIPMWFALDKHRHLLFINRLDWRFLQVKHLHDHICRNDNRRDLF